MWNSKKNSWMLLDIMTFVISTVMFVGVAISAEEKGETKSGQTGKDKIPVKTETKKKKVVKPPSTFVPTDKVSADQAVAFPTDI